MEKLQRQKERLERSARNTDSTKAKKEMETVIEENQTLKKQVTDSEEMVKQANIIINDHTKHIDSMKQKIWNMSKILRMKNEELEVKSEDFEKAIDVIVDLRERLVELGEDLSDDEEED